MMDGPFEGWLEGVQSAMALPPLPRSQKSRPGVDPKWGIGDALLTVPEEHRDHVAQLAGINRTDARSYWRTASAWPPYTRTVPAAWSVYRELAPLPDRFKVISTRMTVRDAIQRRTGKRVDRRAIHRLSDDHLIDELVSLLLSSRGKAVVPRILERLNTSKEGRKAARDRRSAGALRRLDEEIRLVQKEVRKRRAEKSPGLRIMEVKRRLLDTEVNVEEIGLLFNDPDDRQAADEGEWKRLAERVIELRDAANKVANDILSTVDVIEGEAWDEADAWTVPELSGTGAERILDAKIVNED